MIELNHIPTAIKDIRVTVLGAGRSGIGAALLLAKKRADVLLSDSSKITFPKETLTDLESAGVTIELGGHTSKVLDTELVILSPGIPNTSSVVAKIESSCIPIISEIELAYWFAHPSEIIAVTGSNGKTTTTSLIHKMFRNTKYNPYCGGNIGIPFSQLIMDAEQTSIPNRVFILEISSFQLERIIHFHPKISIILNISRDHMDRYPDMNSYISAKLQITRNQDKNDFYIYNSDDGILSNNLPNNCNKLPFGLKPNHEKIININNKNIYTKEGNILIDKSNIRLFGEHNLSNIMAALTVAWIFKLPIDHVRNVLKTFKGLEHRLEYVTTINQVEYYNDSKGTNVGATINALKSFKKPIIAIFGGKDKDSDFSALVPAAKGNVKVAILIGEAAPKIEKALKGAIAIENATSFQQAVLSSTKLSSPGDVILLSPACASFDMFDNFEQRGKVFKEAVLSLTKGKVQ